MDDNQQTPVTDDQELANVLAGMNQQAATPADETTIIDPPSEGSAPLSTPELQFEETPMSPVGAVEEGAPEAPSDEQTPPPVETPSLDTDPEPAEAPAPEIEPAEEAPAVAPIASSSASSELDDIKKDALAELRPLVDKLDLPADEKFDTILLIIRSTDDKTLVNAAHEAARAITDETKRAQALLDVIKEVDYFSGNGENPAA